jgi:predicted GNAT family N-acyltransferase
MASLQTPIPGLTLIKPNPSRHAPITLSWFTSENGRETLLLMGNAEHEIETPSLDSEQQTLQEFVDLEAKNEQLTWMIELKRHVIGVAWIELTKNHNVLPPSVHLMIGDKTYRGRGVGKVVMQTLIQYINDTTDSPAIYSRHLKSNVVVTKMNQSLGFINDKQPYVDDNGLEWQYIKLLI